MRRGLAARMVIGSTLVAMLVAAAFTTLVLALEHERRLSSRSRTSAQLLVVTNHLERIVIDVETGQRGYLLTGEERFLQPWTAGRAAFPATSRQFERLARANGERTQAARITGAVAGYLRKYSIPLVDAARRGDPSVRSIATTQEGKRRVDALRAQFDRLLDSEGARTNERDDQARAATRRAIAAAAVGLAGSVLLIAFFGTYLVRTIVVPVRRAATMAGRLAGGDLAARLPERGVGEIATLERSFNTMASSLEKGHAELTASRARVVAAADEARRRIERDLHDGTQQRLVSLALELRLLESSVAGNPADLRAGLAHAAAATANVIDNLQEVSRGIHPAILAKGGLASALKALARRSTVPVALDVRVGRRLPEPVEVAAYYVVSEALANAAKHAKASVVAVDVEADDAALRLTIRDDGEGGANPAGGSGLLGLRDRVAALGGTIGMTSQVGAGTTLTVAVPLRVDERRS